MGAPLETRDFNGFRLCVYESTHLLAAEFERVKEVFAENYREPNFAYLEKSLGTLAFISLAEDEDGNLAGFALGESRVMDLPRLPGQVVRLAGLCCVSARYRRRGLFGALETMALNARKMPPAERSLSAGRMAHPASFRTMSGRESTVPRPGQSPTPWQQEIGQAIAAAYGVKSFDPETFVVHGPGTPIGWPVMEIEATPEEWKLFEPVDRSKGDSLLGISWIPDAPPGWDD